MTDTSTPTPSEPDGDEGTEGEPDGTKDDTTTKKSDKGDDLVSRSELKEAEKRRDALAARARKAEEALKSLTEERRKAEEARLEAEKERATLAGDIEKVKELAKQEKELLIAEKEGIIADLQGKLTAKEQQLIRSVKEAEVMRILGEVCTDPEVAYMLVQEHIELADDDGKLKPKVKDSKLDIKAFVQKHFEERGKSYLLKSERKPGTGAQPQTNGQTTSMSKQLSIAEINALPSAQQRQYFKEHPEDVDRVLKGVKLSG